MFTTSVGHRAYTSLSITFIERQGGMGWMARASGAILAAFTDRPNAPVGDKDAQ